MVIAEQTVVFLSVSDTVRWRATQPSRNYGVVASRGRRIRCDFPPYRTVPALVTDCSQQDARIQSIAEIRPEDARR